MERTYRTYVKAHGYAIAMVALLIGCIFVASIISEDQLSRSVGEYAFFRIRPLGQLIFSLVWIVAGVIFLLGMLLERKETIFPFATIFAIEWCLILVQLVAKLEQRDPLDLLLSAETAVFLSVPTYVGYTLAVLYKTFDQRRKEDDIERPRSPVKFFFGDEPDDSYS